MNDMLQSSTRLNVIALVGAPNAGKSTLVNQLVGTKISIVTPKVQTTRTTIYGICMEGEAQLIFVDTPGIFRPEKRLDRAMVKAAWSGVHEANYVALLIDVNKGLCKNSEMIIEALKQKETKNILLLNKIDRVKPQVLLEMAAKLNALLPFERTFMISALKGEGVEDVKRYLAEIAPLGPWAYDPDDITNVPERFLACEITREQLFLQLSQELPYAISVDTEKWEVLPKGVKIHQVIYVAKSGHKQMVIGKGGQMIKAIGAAARKELEKVLGSKVHLFLYVKVKEDWSDDPNMYEHMRLECPKG